jgi:NAD-dependent DNA ligase
MAEVVLVADYGVSARRLDEVQQKHADLMAKMMEAGGPHIAGYRRYEHEGSAIGLHEFASEEDCKAFIEATSELLGEFSAALASEVKAAVWHAVD